MSGDANRLLRELLAEEPRRAVRSSTGAALGAPVDGRGREPEGLFSLVLAIP